MAVIASLPLSPPRPRFRSHRIFEIERATPHMRPHWPQADTRSALAAASPRRLLLVVDAMRKLRDSSWPAPCWLRNLLRNGN